jgi:cytochrome P450
VLVFLAAANRDPAVHAEPDEFAPGRDGPQPLSFAFGAHYCLGANLARLEAEVMLASVCERWPDLEQAEVPTWHQRGPFRGVDRLLVRPR